MPPSSSNPNDDVQKQPPDVASEKRHSAVQGIIDAYKSRIALVVDPISEKDRSLDETLESEQDPSKLRRLSYLLQDRERRDSRAIIDQLGILNSGEQNVPAPSMPARQMGRGRLWTEYDLAGDEEQFTSSDSSSEISDEMDSPMMIPQNARRTLQKRRTQIARAQWVHDVREFNVVDCLAKADEAGQVLETIRTRLETQTGYIANILQEYSNEVSTLTIGAHKQSQLQLSNIANKGWFNTGQGGSIDLSRVMEPFLASKADYEREVQTDFTTITSQRKVFPIDRDRIKRSESKITQTALSELEERGRFLMKLQEKEGSDFDNELELAEIKFFLFMRYRDESLLEESDWKIIFPSGEIPGDQAPNDPDLIAKLYKENRRFVQIYFRGEYDDEGSSSMEDGEGGSEREMRILAALKRHIEKLVEEEDEVHHTLQKTLNEIKASKKWQFLGPLSLGCWNNVDEKALRRSIRKSNRAARLRREKLYRVWPGGISGRCLTPPPAPLNLTVRPHQGSGDRYTGDHNEYGKEPSRYGEQSRTKKSVLSTMNSSGSGMDMRCNIANQGEGWELIDDKSYSDWFLKAIGIDPRELLTGESDDTVSAHMRADRKSIIDEIGRIVGVEATAFTCTSKAAQKMPNTTLSNNQKLGNVVLVKHPEDFIIYGDSNASGVKSQKLIRPKLLLPKASKWITMQHPAD